MTKSAPGDALYAGREQTGVKHHILRKYLERFARIVGMGTQWKSITYVDCFSGPWNSNSEKFEDSSFFIALEELRSARRTVESAGRELSIRCFFIEKNKSSHAKLKAFTDGIQDATLEVKNKAFEDSIDDIRSFVRKDSKTFPFLFIDPTGWTGFAMNTIQPLLQMKPSEVLVNFMTGHIRRFIESPLEQSQESFRELFGSDEYREQLADKEEQDREDAAIRFYVQSLMKAGNFDYVCCAMVLHPEFDRTHFHLIYATRNAKGVEVFKEAEKQAMQSMEEARSEAKHRRKEKNPGTQSNLFAETPRGTSRHYDLLRGRYQDDRRRELRNWLEKKKRVSYREAWAFALRAPMVWESDLREWIDDWSEQGRLRVEGLGSKERVPKRSGNVTLVWKEEQDL